MNKKITKTTIKSFIRKNQESLHIRPIGSFDGFVDCVIPFKWGFSLVVKTELFLEYTLGIDSFWFVGRDSYSTYSDGSFVGFAVHNSCGSFIIAVPSNQ